MSFASVHAILEHNRAIVSEQTPDTVYRITGEAKGPEYTLDVADGIVHEYHPRWI